MTADGHFKLLLGDIAGQLAFARAENEKLEQTVATLEAECMTLRVQLAAASTTAPTNTTPKGKKKASG